MNDHQDAQFVSSQINAFSQAIDQGEFTRAIKILRYAEAESGRMLVRDAVHVVIQELAANAHAPGCQARLDLQELLTLLVDGQV